MSLPIHVDAYSGYRANERPCRFELDDDAYEIEATELRWYTPREAFFRVRTTDGKRYLLRYDEHEDRWSLQGGLDGDELLARPNTELITVGPEAIREAERRIAGCEKCRPDDVEIPSDCILADVLDKRGPFGFLLTEAARCPNCRAPVVEATVVEPGLGEGGDRLPPR